MKSTAMLKAALKDLETSTDALLEANIDDVVAVCTALEHRADAITRVAFLMEESGAKDDLTLESLAAALARGEGATRRALGMKLDATEEWQRMSRMGQVHGQPEMAVRKPD